MREGTETRYQAAREVTTGEIITRHPVVIHEDDVVKAFLEKLLNDNATQVPVLVGIVAKYDLLRPVATEITD